MSKSVRCAPHVLPPCRICGQQAKGFHYGVNTCDACKVFITCRSCIEMRAIVVDDHVPWCVCQSVCLSVTEQLNGSRSYLGWILLESKVHCVGIRSRSSYGKEDEVAELCPVWCISFPADSLDGATTIRVIRCGLRQVTLSILTVGTR